MVQSSLLLSFVVFASVYIIACIATHVGVMR
jgi:hypothetical protein